jgi:hypothetical protein
VYPKFITYHPTPIGATRAFRLLYINQLPTAWRSGVYPKFITYHPTPIVATRAFRLLYINHLPGVEWSGVYPKFIISSNADRLDVIFPLLYIIQLPVVERSVPKIYYVSSSADRSNSRFSFVIYQSTACILVERTQNILYIIQRQSERPTPIGATRAFRLLYINQLPGVEWSGVEWSVPKIYYISSNADRLDVLFLLLYIIQLPVVE